MEKGVESALTTAGQPAPGSVERARCGSLRFLPELDNEAPSEWLELDLLVGYATRVAEFRALKAPEFNSSVQAELVWANGRGHDWYTAVCSIVHSCLIAVTDDPFEYEVLLKPVGFGHQVHHDWCSGGLDTLHRALQEAPQFPASVKENVERVGPQPYCWWFGYYLRGCESSLPDEARAELAEVKAD